MNAEIVKYKANEVKGVNIAGHHFIVPKNAVPYIGKTKLGQTVVIFRIPKSNSMNDVASMPEKFTMNAKTGEIKDERD